MLVDVLAVVFGAALVYQGARRIQRGESVPAPTQATSPAFDVPVRVTPIAVAPVPAVTVTTPPQVRSGLVGGASGFTPETTAAVTANPRDVDFMARTIWGEARSEPRLGQVAVGHVIMNRVLDNRGQWPNTVEAVVRQGEGSQFNVWRTDDPNYERMINVTNADANFALAVEIANSVLTGAVPDPVKGAFIYFNPATSTNRSFVRRVRELASEEIVIGQHSFFPGVR